MLNILKNMKIEEHMKEYLNFLKTVHYFPSILRTFFIPRRMKFFLGGRHRARDIELEDDSGGVEQPISGRLRVDRRRDGANVWSQWSCRASIMQPAVLRLSRFKMIIYAFDYF